MANLLLETTKSKRAWQRYIRVTIVAVVAGVVGVLLASASLLPVVMYTYVVAPSIDLAQSIQPKTSVGAQRQATKLKLGSHKALVSSVQSIYDRPQITPIVRSVINKVTALPEVNLSRLEVQLVESGYTILVVGATKTRGTVVDIQQMLKSRVDVRLVDFPIGNFASHDGEYNFSARLETAKD